MMQEIFNNIPAMLLLTVGLCQIGAAVMGERGYRYDEILLHYYKGAEVKTMY